MNSNNSYLVLDSGEIFSGVSEVQGESVGEVVFNTSHTGYEEVATDPSYYSQIVVMTAPMQGNYGVDRSVWESRRLWIEGFICLQLQKSEREKGWLNRLKDSHIPMLSEVDTRTLVMRLREGGTPWGAILSSPDREKAQNMIKEKKSESSDWVFCTSQKEVSVHQGIRPSGPVLGLLDLGCKSNILRELLTRSSRVVVFPARASSADILSSSIQGLLLSNGPGDPSQVLRVPQTVQELIGKIPIFGICMGHQILAISLGAQTYKLKFGHRGSNHPIKDELLNKVYVSSQNHGYAVKASSLPQGVKVTQVNLNDQTVAGIFDPMNICLGIQYHPESCPGPHEARELFDFFVNKMVSAQQFNFVKSQEQGGRS